MFGRKQTSRSASMYSLSSAEHSSSKLSHTEIASIATPSLQQRFYIGLYSVQSRTIETDSHQSLSSLASISAAFTQSLPDVDLSVSY